MYAKVQGTTLIRFPYNLGALYEENPSTNYGPDPDFVSIFPGTDEARLHGYSLAEVSVLPEPSFDGRTQKIQQKSPEFIDGSCFVSWDIIQKTDDEIAADTAQKSFEIRNQRNQRLSACDWTQLADAPVDKAAWASYRQALRDIPSQVGFPWDVNWPERP
jgi:hypothetical protein